MENTLNKLFIASDIHGDAACAELLIKRYKESGAKRLLLLGDLLYHGPRNDLPAGYAPKKVIPLLNGLKNEIITVRGNCESEVDGMVLEFPVLADYAFLMADGLNIFATHGHKHSPENPPPLKRGDILLCGHTHVPAATELEGGIFYINPGSVSIPKEDSPKSYIVYENRTFTFYTLDGEKYKSFQL